METFNKINDVLSEHTKKTKERLRIQVGTILLQEDLAAAYQYLAGFMDSNRAINSGGAGSITNLIESVDAGVARDITIRLTNAGFRKALMEEAA